MSITIRKLFIYRTLYGSESWTLSIPDKRRIEAMDMEENDEDQLDRKEIEYGSGEYGRRTEINYRNDGNKKY